MNPILLVTTDPELTRAVESALRETPAKVVATARSAKAAAEALAQHPSALVLIDLFLPGNTGMDALKNLKSMNEEGLFILLTRMRTRSHIERAFRLGAQDVLYWPVSPEVLTGTILHRLREQPSAEAEEPEEPAQSKPAPKR